MAVAMQCRQRAKWMWNGYDINECPGYGNSGNWSFDIGSVP